MDSKNSKVKYKNVSIETKRLPTILLHKKLLFLFIRG